VGYVCNSPKIYQNKSRAKNIFKSLFIVELNPSEIVPRPISQSPEKPVPTSESNRRPVSLFFLVRARRFPPKPRHALATAAANPAGAPPATTAPPPLLAYK
jgi:hypothetical protein